MTMARLRKLICFGSYFMCVVFIVAMVWHLNNFWEDAPKNEIVVWICTASFGFPTMVPPCQIRLLPENLPTKFKNNFLGNGNGHFLKLLQIEICPETETASPEGKASSGSSGDSHLGTWMLLERQLSNFSVPRSKPMHFEFFRSQKENRNSCYRLRGKITKMSSNEIASRCISRSQIPNQNSRKRQNGDTNSFCLRLWER